MLSVIVPIYNVEKYLQESLESLHQQELREVEFILIIDGSKDNSKAICDSFILKDERFRLIVKENEGYGKTCNLGIQKAQGDYIAIFEPDDKISPKMYKKLYELAQQYHVDIVRSNFIYVKGHNLSPSPSFLPAIHDPNHTSQYHIGIKPLDSELFYGESLPTQLCFEPYELFSRHSSIWANLYKKEFLTQNHIYFMETPGAAFQDFPFHVETFSLAKHILWVNEAFYYYRVHDNNSSSKGKQTFIHIDLIDYLIEDKKLLHFIPPDTYSSYLKAFIAQYIWWLNKNRSLAFTWKYTQKISFLFDKHNWFVDHTFSISEQKLIKSYTTNSHITQFFYTLYTMFTLLSSEHESLKKRGLRWMKIAEIICINLKIIQRIKIPHESN